MNRPNLFALAIGAVASLASLAAADYTVSFPGTNHFAASGGVTVTTPALIGTCTGVIFDFNYANAANASWASDMACTVSTSQWGGYDVLVNGTTDYEGATGAPNSGAATHYVSGTLALATPIVMSGGTLLVGIGNGYSAGICDLTDCTVTLVGVTDNITTPTNPVVSNVQVARATPGLLVSGDTVNVTAAVANGLNPTSTNMQVTANLTNIGGGAAVAMLDDGVAPDAAVDGVYTCSAAATGAGTQTVTVNAVDFQTRTASANGSVTINVVTDIGSLGGSDSDPNTGDVITHSYAHAAGEVVWVKFTLESAVADDAAATVASYLDIDTETTGIDESVVGSPSDTELGIYSSTGTFIDTDDDSGSFYHSLLTFGDTDPVRPAMGTAPNAGFPGDGFNGDLAAGTYYLAVGNFNCVFNANFNVVYTAQPAAAAGTYVVNFRTNLPSLQCSLADVGVQGGSAGQDNLLDNNDFVVFIQLFFEQSHTADVGQQGGLPGPDMLWDNNDFVVFIQFFFTDQPNCTG